MARLKTMTIKLPQELSAKVASFAAPLETCDAVVAESWHLLGRARGEREALLGLLGSGSLKLSFSLASDGPSAFRLMRKYADQPMSVADACLVRMAALDERATIVTLDSNFKVYKRGRLALRLAAPFSGTPRDPQL